MLAQMSVLSRKWFPGREVNTQCMAEAVFLENDYWDKMRVAVNNGVVRAFEGE